MFYFILQIFRKIILVLLHNIFHLGILYLVFAILIFHLNNNYWKIIQKNIQALSICEIIFNLI